MGDQSEFNALDLISVMSLILGYQNLVENRQQSRHNDVAAANDNQAQFLLSELFRRFDEQNEMLKKIMEALNIENDKTSV